MDIITRRATEFADRELEGATDADEFMKKLNAQLYPFNKKDEKLKFITTVAEQGKAFAKHHAIGCTAPKVCLETICYDEALHFMDEMLKGFNIGINQEQVFSQEEQTALTQKIDELLREIEKLRKGQEIIYDDFMKEVEELKHLFFIGKKNWKQIAAGKAVEMITSGVVSGTISQKLIDMTGYTVSSGQISQ